MARVTNLGRKRNYLEAGFASTDQLGDVSTPPSDANSPDASGEKPVDMPGTDGEPPKKKRKRIKKKKPKTDSAQRVSLVEGDEDGGAAEEGDKNGVVYKANATTNPTKKALKKKKWKEMEKQKKQRRLLASDLRRQNRIQERLADTTCFACRGRGHAAKDCPNVKSEGTSINQGKKLVGICYRCGSTRHMLSKCKKAVDESSPFPFASCFVCGGKGHLASTCPQNQEKGIYPNGGCCKLCGEKTHLAKDCDLRRKDNASTLAVMGSGDRPGADEDDFHTFKRRKQEVEKEVKSKDTKRQMLQLKMGAQSGIMKSFGSAPKLVKKVVYF